MKNIPQLLIFDVNETLLDMEPLQNAINDALGFTSAFDIWFSELLKFSLVESAIGEYHDFGEIALRTLTMTAQKYSVAIEKEDLQKILKITTMLKAFPEVKEMLYQLKNAGFVLVALTNGGQKTVEKQLKFAGIAAYFTSIYSVEQVRKFKPHPETYNFVLDRSKKCYAYCSSRLGYFRSTTCGLTNWIYISSEKIFISTTNKTNGIG